MNDIMVFSVYEVNLHIRQLIETSLEPLYISGEISNFVHHSSGHMYFNLKDENATLRCTFFKNANYRLDFRPEDGMKVICFGKISVYEKGGSYNLNVSSMQADGQGDLARQFELLKKKLEAEGLFDPAHKKRLPKYPRKIGLVTSPTGAALQDIMNILKRRFPVELILYPALVQGTDAAPTLVKGIQQLNQMDGIDLIIITRGGGSQEDLWAFNDEALARAIYASRLPVVSAVGHEIDFSISDFVADLRAPTPSAAAEIAVPDKEDLLNYISAVSNRMDILIKRDFQAKRQELDATAHKHKALAPQNQLNRLAHRLDMAAMLLENALRYLRDKKQGLTATDERFRSRAQFKLSKSLIEHRAGLLAWEKMIQNGAENCIKSRQQTLAQIQLRLEAASPQTIMDRGYSILRKNGRLVKSITDLQPGDEVDLRLSDGIACLGVKDVSSL